MKKSLAIALLSMLVMSSTGAAQAADDNKVVAGAKKVGCCIVWPFKKLGQGMKAAKEKLTGK